MARKSTRGAQGSGSIRKRPDGRWEARYTSGVNPQTGKQVQRSIYGKTQKEVREKLRSITAKIDKGVYTEPIRITLGEWLDIWLKEYTGNMKPHTKKSYEATVKNHIKPVLGKVRIQELPPIHIQKFINGLTNSKDDSKPLNPKTAKNIHGVLHSALQQAVRIGYLRTNPATMAILPKRSASEINPLKDKEVAQFLTEIKGHKFEYLYLVDLFTGIRQSEIIGLQWDDVDFDQGCVTIRRQLQFLGSKYGGYQFTSPKNNKIRQIYPAKFVMDTLRQQKRRQAEMRLLAGPAWSNPNSLVFTDEFGKHLNHDLVYRHLKRLFIKMGLPKLRFHDLRHSYAVLSIQAGDDIKTVQENLGHYSAAFTLDVYGHVTEQMKPSSSERMEQYIHMLDKAQ